MRVIAIFSAPISLQGPQDARSFQISNTKDSLTKTITTLSSICNKVDLYELGFKSFQLNVLYILNHFSDLN